MNNQPNIDDAIDSILSKLNINKSQITYMSVASTIMGAMYQMMLQHENETQFSQSQIAHQVALNFCGQLSLSIINKRISSYAPQMIDEQMIVCVDGQYELTPMGLMVGHNHYTMHQQERQNTVALN